MASKIQEWCERIGQEFTLRGNENFGKYTVLEVPDGETLILKRDDGYRLEAHLPQLNPDGTIEWAYSSGGHFPQESKPLILKDLLDKGSFDNVLILNKYNEFLAEGNPAELRKEPLWNLLDESSAIVEKNRPVLTENGTAMCFIISNFPRKDRPLEQLQEQLTSLLENEDFSDIEDDDLRSAKRHQFDMQIEKLKEHIELAELREEANAIGSLWYVDEKSGDISNVWYNPDSKTNGAIIQSTVKADVLFEVMDEVRGEFGEPFSLYFTDFWESITEKNQIRTDVNSPDFRSVLDTVKANMAIKTPAFIGDNEETYKGLMEFAKKTVQFKEAAELDSLWYVNEETGRICNVYFNPDSGAGGTFHENIIYAGELLEVVKLMGENVEENFYSDIEVSCKQYNSDIGTSEFELMLNNLKNDIEENIFTFRGDTEETMNSLITISEKFMKDRVDFRKMSDTELMYDFLVNQRYYDRDSIPYFEMERRQLIGKNDSVSDLRRHLKEYTENPQFESVVMKAYTLIIDTSASNPEGSQIYVYEADTLQETKDKLTELNLSFEQGDVYCVTIGKRSQGTLNRYQQIERTDNGINWYEDKSDGRAYIPVDWKRIDDWQNIDKFKNPEPEVKGFILKVFNSDNELVNENWCETHKSAMNKASYLTGNQTYTVEPTHETYEDYYNRNNPQIQFTSPETAAEIIIMEETIMSNIENTKIVARVAPIENGTNLKGSATVTIGDQISVHGIKIVQGEKGLFVSMPGEMGKNGKFYDTVLPKSESAAVVLSEAVLNAYQEALVKGKQQKEDLNPSELSVKVSNLRENPYENNIKGDCQITINNMLVIKGVKIIAAKETGELGVALPSKQDENGGYIPVANAVTKDFYEQIKAKVIDYYQNPPQTLGNTSYGKLADKKAGEEVIHKTYNSQFAEKIGAELDAAHVKWSAKIEPNNKTVIAVNKNDSEKLEAAVDRAKPPQEVKPVQPETVEPPKTSRKM